MSSCCDGGVSAADRNKAGFRLVLWLALVSNAGMFAVELVASWLSGSVALQADALDFFGDAANYAITLFVLGMSLSARSYAALFKGITMGLFGVWVIGSAVYRLAAGTVPDPAIMGVVGLLALAVNVAVAIMLFRFRDGDANARSVWLCSRNDAIANVAVVLAASGVFVTASGWPDIAVASLIAALSLSAAAQVITAARRELHTGLSASAAHQGRHHPASLAD